MTFRDPRGRSTARALLLAAPLLGAGCSAPPGERPSPPVASPGGARATGGVGGTSAGAAGDAAARSDAGGEADGAGGAASGGAGGTPDARPDGAPGADARALDPRRDAAGDARRPSPRDGAGSPASGCGEGDVPLPSGGLLFWLDPGQGVQAAGGRVSQWTDRSPHGRAARPAGGAPVLVPAGVNGRPVLRFAGTSLSMVAPVDGLTGMTVALVAATTELWMSQPEWCMRSSEAGCSNTYNSPLQWFETDRFGMVHLSPLQTVVVFRFGVGASGDNGEYKPTHRRPTPVGARFTSAIAVHDRAVNRLWVDGARVRATLTDGTSHEEIPSPEGRAAIAHVRDVVTIGSGTFGHGWTGDLAEIVVYGRALSGDEVATVDRHFRCRYFPGR